MTSPDMPLLGAKKVVELLRSRDVRPKKSLGQNFVIDPNTIGKVLRIAAIQPTDVILEVGAGVGSLTSGLAASGATVVALEVDERLVAISKEVTKSYERVEIVQADALKVDLESISATKVVANLPYNVAATLVLKILEEAPAIETLTVMTQREVGERLAARSGSKSYGITSVLAGFHADVRVAGQVSRHAFYPEPNVDSVIVQLDRVPVPDVDAQVFKAVVKSAFAQRRKTIRNGLIPLAENTSAVRGLLEVAGIDPSSRAEDIEIEGFVAISRALQAARL